MKTTDWKKEIELNRAKHPLKDVPFQSMNINFTTKINETVTIESKFDYQYLFDKYDFKRIEYEIRSLHLNGSAFLYVYAVIDEFKLQLDGYAYEIRLELEFENTEHIESFIKSFPKYQDED